MRVALLLTLLATSALADDIRGRFDRFCTRSDQGRNTRGFDCGGIAFQFAPADGSGMTADCQATNPTGTKGEALTSARASTATCTAGTSGLRASSIAVGDLTNITSNIVRVERDANGVRGILIEQAGTNTTIRSEELDNVAWTSTAAVTANAATPPNNTSQLSNAEQLNDVSAAAFQGSCQTIATTSATQHVFYAYVRAGTASTAQVTMVGTGSATGDCSATVSGLSGTTWNILECVSPAAYGGTLTAVTVCVNVGNVVGITGTIMAWGADHKEGFAYRTSYVPTSGSAVTRASEMVTFTGVPLSALAASGSTAASVTPMGTSMTGGLVVMNGSGRLMYSVGTTLRMYDGTTEPTLAHGFVFNTTKRYWTSWTGATQTLTNVSDVTTNSGAFDGAMDTTGPLGIGGTAVIGLMADWIVTRICLDPNPFACRTP